AGRRADEAIRPEARGDVTPVAIAVFTSPDAAADVADLLFDFVRRFRVEKAHVIRAVRRRWGHRGIVTGRRRHGRGRSRAGVEDDLDSSFREDVLRAGREPDFHVLPELFRAGFHKLGGFFLGDQLHSLLLVEKFIDERGAVGVHGGWLLKWAG